MRTSITLSTWLVAAAFLTTAFARPVDTPREIIEIDLPGLPEIEVSIPIPTITPTIYIPPVVPTDIPGVDPSALASLIPSASVNLPSILSSIPTFDIPAVSINFPIPTVLPTKVERRDDDIGISANISEPTPSDVDINVSLSFPTDLPNIDFKSVVDEIVSAIASAFPAETSSKPHRTIAHLTARPLKPLRSPLPTA